MPRRLKEALLDYCEAWMLLLFWTAFVWFAVRFAIWAVLS